MKNYFFLFIIVVVLSSCSVSRETSKTSDKATSLAEVEVFSATTSADEEKTDSNMTSVSTSETTNDLEETIEETITESVNPDGSTTRTTNRTTKRKAKEVTFQNDSVNQNNEKSNLSSYSGAGYVTKREMKDNATETKEITSSLNINVLADLGIVIMLMLISVILYKAK